MASGCSELEEDSAVVSRSEGQQRTEGRERQDHDQEDSSFPHSGIGLNWIHPTALVDSENRQWEKLSEQASAS